MFYFDAKIATTHLQNLCGTWHCVCVRARAYVDPDDLGPPMERPLKMDTEELMAQRVDREVRERYELACCGD